ncbi:MULTISPECIES: hypothetical protein [Pectobacterium]|uniref:Xylose isomerase-like TIM barrel domain-containing protein n=2 Tax=Pectobacterium parvum TaxID=2778550 RepID=A0AAP9IEA1_9GAMM|nr:MULTISPECIES: hypothetical protein [Pectobacterium]QHQ23225.1 hypothetical protein GMX10_03375 [Pectobacterium parvum]
MMITFSSPFLATDRTQMVMPETSEIRAVEATIFNMSDLFDTSWGKIWDNISYAIKMYGSRNVSFHFPINNCNFVNDPFVKKRLYEAFSRVNDLGMAGMVVHSNQIHNFEWWSKNSLTDTRRSVIDVLDDLTSKAKTSSWLALENMPVMDNYGIEIDPTFVFPSDFKELRGTGINVVWDFCHFASTIASIEYSIKESIDDYYYPNKMLVDYNGFKELEDIIVHWHFSAFKGISAPMSKHYCEEGTLPYKGTLDESVYIDAWKFIALRPSSEKVVFEVQESNYYLRKNMIKMIDWGRNHAK